MHAATKAGTLGLALICLAVMVEAETWGQVVEALFVFVFMIASAPVGAHLIGRAAFRTRAPDDPQDAASTRGARTFAATRREIAAARSVCYSRAKILRRHGHFAIGGSDISTASGVVPGLQPEAGAAVVERG